MRILFRLQAQAPIILSELSELRTAVMEKITNHQRFRLELFTILLRDLRYFCYSNQFDLNRLLPPQGDLFVLSSHWEGPSDQAGSLLNQLATMVNLPAKVTGSLHQISREWAKTKTSLRHLARLARLSMVGTIVDINLDGRKSLEADRSLTMEWSESFARDANLLATVRVDNSILSDSGETNSGQRKFLLKKLNRAKVSFHLFWI